VQPLALSWRHGKAFLLDVEHELADKPSAAEVSHQIIVGSSGMLLYRRIFVLLLLLFLRLFRRTSSFFASVVTHSADLIIP
jgi:hypothetical protein